MSQWSTRFLACNVKRTSLLAYYRLLIFVTIVVISESPGLLCFSIVRSNDYAYLLSNHYCDRHLWTHRPFTSFYHVTSIESRQNRKPCGQLSSLASETKTCELSFTFYINSDKLYRLHNERNSAGVLGLNMFYGFTLAKANLWWFWDQITISHERLKTVDIIKRS